MDYSPLKLATVTGTVTLDGEPLAGATVDFEEAGVIPTLFSRGETDQSGRYKLVYDSWQDGVKPGKKIVRIRGGRRDEGEDATGGRVPARYNSDSTLERTVEPNGNHTFDFELTSD